jgi:hypothetical protein
MGLYNPPASSGGGSGGSGGSDGEPNTLSNGVAPTVEKGVHIYVAAAAMTIPLPAMDSWAGWIPIFVFEGTSGQLSLTPDATEPDTINGSSSNLSIPAEHGHVMLAKTGDHAAVSLADPFQ